jgi:hypothetical protein
VDFRGKSGAKPGGLHSDQPIHAGLVCLNAHGVMDLGLQEQLFALALQNLAVMNHLINGALEITLTEDGMATVERYGIPTDSP